MAETGLVQILEGALLAAGRPLSVQNLAALFEEDARPENTEIRAALKTIAERCEDCGYELQEVASGFRFAVRRELGPWIQRLMAQRPPRYSRALLETLVLIAYRQPVTRGEIEEIRGVSVSSNIIRTLHEREWIRVVGHRDVPGRPAMYATTRQFLDYFNLRNLGELPELQESRDLDALARELGMEDLLAAEGEPAADEVEGEPAGGESPDDHPEADGEADDEADIETDDETESEVESEANGDAGAGLDTDTEAYLEEESTDSDVGPDAVDIDAETEADLDEESVDADAGPDVSPDAVPDAVSEAVSDAVSDAVPEVRGGDVLTDTDTEDHEDPRAFMSEKDEKLQKVLARIGLGSRREMERWIAGGRVHINGRLATLGDRVDAQASIAVDGRAVTEEPGRKVRVLLYHKPPGEVCTRSDPEGRKTVFERLPSLKKGRWISVGRLDYNTSGLLLFTTDGELANALMHPSSQVEREYMVRVKGEVTADTLATLHKGVMLEDGPARFTDIQDGGGEGSNHWYYVVIMEGRTREVRRLWESQHCVVSRLKRTRYGNVFLPSAVKRGMWAELEKNQVRQLYEQVGLPPREVATPSSTTPRNKSHKKRSRNKTSRNKEPLGATSRNKQPHSKKPRRRA